MLALDLCSRMKIERIFLLVCMYFLPKVFYSFVMKTFVMKISCMFLYSKSRACIFDVTLIVIVFIPKWVTGFDRCKLISQIEPV